MGTVWQHCWWLLAHPVTRESFPGRYGALFPIAPNRIPPEAISGGQVINCGSTQGTPAWQRAQTQSHVTSWGLTDARPSERGQTQRGRCAVISSSNRHPWEAGQWVSLAGRVPEGRGAAGRWAGSGSDPGAVTQLRLVGIHPGAACDRSAAELVVLCL